MRFLKSILKKESKYEHDYFKALVTNQGFKLGNQKAADIRDSIELTKEKGKSAETPKTIKKEIRESSNYIISLKFSIN